MPLSARNIHIYPPATGRSSPTCSHGSGPPLTSEEGPERGRRENHKKKHFFPSNSAQVFCTEKPPPQLTNYLPNLLLSTRKTPPRPCPTSDQFLRGSEVERSLATYARNLGCSAQGEERRPGSNGFFHKGRTRRFALNQVSSQSNFGEAGLV